MRSPNFTSWQQKEGRASIREQDDEAPGLTMVKIDYRFTSMGGGANFIPSSYVDLMFFCGYKSKGVTVCGYKSKGVTGPVSAPGQTPIARIVKLFCPFVVGTK